MSSTIRHHVLYSLCPAHRGSQLVDEVLLDDVWIDIRLCIHVLVHWTSRIVEMCSSNGILQFFLSRLHQRRVECATYRQYQRTFGTGFFHADAGLVDTF